jgi:hypothetical protein
MKGPDITDQEQRSHRRRTMSVHGLGFARMDGFAEPVHWAQE